MEEEVQTDNVEVYRTSGETMRKSGVYQCESHNWRKHSENEIACTLCPTVNIVENVDEFLA